MTATTLRAGPSGSAPAAGVRQRRVLSLWQPWATLCVATDPVFGHPPKRNETRHWQPYQRLPIPVVIHAAKRWGPDNRFVAEGGTLGRVLARCGYLNGGGPLVPVADGRPLPFGAIIGVATIVAVTSTERVLRERVGRVNPASALTEAAADPDVVDTIAGNYAPGRYAWTLADVCALAEPIPFRGRQDPLYLLPDDVQALVDAQLAAVGVPA